MPYWYYAGKTTSCIDLPSEDDHRVSVPTILVPRQRFYAPKSAVHHLLNTKPPQVKSIKEPRKQRQTIAAKVAPVPEKTVAPEPVLVLKVRTEEPKSVAPVVEEAESHRDANPSEDVLASPTSDVEVEEGPVSEGTESVPEPEKKSFSRRRKSRKRSSSSSEDD